MPKNESKIQLTGDLEKAAVSAINAFAKAEQTQRKGISTMSGHILKLAVLAQEKGGEKAEELFGALTRHAEKVYKEEHSEDVKTLTPIAKLLPGWPVAKSQVLKGMKAKLDLADYTTVYEVIEATPTAARKPRGQTEAGTNGTAGVKVSANVAAAMERMGKAIAATPPELEDSLIGILSVASAEIEELTHVTGQAEAKARGTVDAGAVRPAANG